MRPHPFTRPTLVAAVELLGVSLVQAKFDQLVVRVGLDDKIVFGGGVGRSVSAKSAMFASEVLRRKDAEWTTAEGMMTFGEAIVREAVGVTRSIGPHAEQDPFLRGLALDGYVVAWDEANSRPFLRAALPEEIQLPQTDDEVHQLLKQFGFDVPAGHLDQAIQAHTRGDWAAANGQLRTFIEGLFDAIAHHVDTTEATRVGSSENRRAMLGNRGFLSKARNEWSDDGKNFVNGLFKMLHTEGSHPGLSDEERSTFRLHLALVTSRTFLRRLHYGA